MLLTLHSFIQLAILLEMMMKESGEQYQQVLRRDVLFFQHAWEICQHITIVHLLWEEWHVQTAIIEAYKL